MSKSPFVRWKPPEIVPDQYDQDEPLMATVLFRSRQCGNDIYCWLFEVKVVVRAGDARPESLKRARNYVDSLGETVKLLQHLHPQFTGNLVQANVLLRGRKELEQILKVARADVPRSFRTMGEN